ncbi:hypothetical protein LAV72_18515 [Lysinibacillus xylanilyticus]|uniref:hypothetical protein n=1 Tax=Lysinibacillus xylanilyticus TaxID=582475 RepID=UPI002B247372|nr:hypothetical protein [Lysinibacillus xylanilyticus]MEB2301600.1 hypothetical protein [Lysinibacillus xylanilyticus]
MKKWFLRWLFLTIFLLCVFGWYSGRDYQKRLVEKEEAILLFQNNEELEITKQQEAAKIEKLAIDYIFSHAVGNLEFFHMSTTYEAESENPYADWVIELNRILKQKEIDSWTTLFKPELFQEWYSNQDIKNSPETFLSEFLINEYSSIKRFDYFTWRNENYFRINYTDGQISDKKLPLIKRDDSLVINMSVEEWENYIKRTDSD